MSIFSEFLAILVGKCFAFERFSLLPKSLYWFFFAKNTKAKMNILFKYNRWIFFHQENFLTLEKRFVFLSKIHFKKPKFIFQLEAKGILLSSSL